MDFHFHNTRPFLLNIAADDLGNLAPFSISSLSSSGVTHCAPSDQAHLGVVVRLDNQAVGAGGNRSQGHRFHQLGIPGGVRGIDDNGQVGFGLDDRMTLRSSVLRVYFSKVRMPRSHMITFHCRQP